MNWKDVGNWLQDNAGTGAALVGSLLTGNVPGAVASGVALVTSATGQGSAAQVLEALQTDPETMLQLKRLAVEDDENIRNHIKEMVRIEMEDDQKSHATTQATIVNGDNSEDVFVRRTRPAQSWTSLIFAGCYVFFSATVDVTILGLLLTLPFSYAGLRQVGKWGSSKHAALAIAGDKK